MERKTLQFLSVALTLLVGIVVLGHSSPVFAETAGQLDWVGSNWVRPVEPGYGGSWRPNPPRYVDRPVRPVGFAPVPRPPQRPVVPEEPHRSYPPVRPEEPVYPGWGGQGPGYTRGWVYLGWIGDISRRQWIYFPISHQLVNEVFLRTRSPFTIHDAYLNLSHGGRIRIHTLIGYYPGGRQFLFFVDGRNSWLSDSLILEVTPHTRDRWLSELWVGVY